jgi:ankyrin repeat protein
LTCGSYYCNYCFACFRHEDRSQGRADAHEHAAQHKSVSEGEHRDAFLPIEQVREGQKQHQRSQIIHFLRLLIQSREYLTERSNGMHIASLVLLLCRKDISSLGLDLMDIWREVLVDVNGNEIPGSSTQEIEAPPPFSVSHSLALAICSQNHEAALQILNSSREELDANYMYRIQCEEGEFGYPIITLAVLSGMDDVALALLHRDADLMRTDERHGRSVLYVIIERGGKQLVDAVFELLADFDWNQPLTLEESRYHALHIAARYNRGQWVERLVHRGASLNAEESELHYDPLLTAVVLDHHWAALELIRCGANPSNMTHHDKCAAAVAAERGHLSVLSAFCGKHPELMASTVDCEHHWRLLDVAIAFKQHHVVRYLIQKGADISYVDKEGRSPIMVAALFEDEFSAVQLIEAGADLHNSVCNNRTPLFLAVEKSFHLMLQAWLNRCPTDVNEYCCLDQRMRPLAVSVCFRNLGISQLLLRMGAQVDLPNGDGDFTAFHLSVTERNIALMQLLMEHNAKLDVYSKDGRSVLFDIVRQGSIDALYIYQQHLSSFDVNADITKTGDGMKCLHVAAMYNHPHLISLLLTMNADVNARNTKGETALDIARTVGSTEAELALASHLR